MKPDDFSVLAWTVGIFTIGGFFVMGGLAVWVTTALDEDDDKNGEDD